MTPTSGMTPTPQSPHVPVMLPGVLDTLSPRDGGLYVDCTFGNGGYSQGLLKAADCSVIALDRDPSVRPRAAELEAAYPGRFRLLEGCFGDMAGLLEAAGVGPVDGVAVDLGVSSMQLDQAERGFSFQADGPLDMRMSSSGPTAADLVNSLGEEELAGVIFRYGEERHSRRIARAIVRRRAETPFERTADLAYVVRGAMPGGAGRRGEGIDPATRTFQALRIQVNDELGELDRVLSAAEQVLAPGGRLAVVSFHSLEDRIVKTFLRDRSGVAAGVSRHLPPTLSGTGGEREPTFRLLHRRAQRPDDGECAVNPRSRSARLRAAERTDAAPWPTSNKGHDR